MAKIIKTKEIILGQILEGLNQAAGAAGLLIHHQQNTYWMGLRGLLEAVKGQIVSYSVEPLLKPKPPEIAK